jgi:hypothetical protein
MPDSPKFIAYCCLAVLVALAGIATSLRWRTAVTSFAALGVAILFAILQLLAFRISLIPYIATR